MKVLFAGDIVINDASRFNYSKDVTDFINLHDYKICNFEAPIIGKQTQEIIKIGPRVQNNPASSKLISEIGFNVAALANNHIMDYGMVSLKNTQKELNNYGVEVFGASDIYEKCYDPLRLVKNGEEIFVFNACQAEFGVFKDNNSKMGGYAWVNNPDFLNKIKEYCNGKNKVIVYVHAGLEDELLPLPEWRNVYRNLVDSGVSLVVASHPHIIQGVEKYREKNIYYSLGNFFFDLDNYSENDEWCHSMLLSVDTMTGDECIKYVSFIGGKISFVDEMEMNVKLKYRNDILKNENDYICDINEICNRCWNSYYKSYYESACGNIKLNKKNMKWWVRSIIKAVFGRIPTNEINEAFLLHNVQIESHRWAVERYLYNRINMVDDIGQMKC